MAIPEDTEKVLTTDAIGIEMAVLVLFTAALVYYYRAKEVPYLVGITVFVSWLLGFMGTLLLPADIVLTLLNGEHSRWVTKVWYMVYWTTFFLAWVAIPILASSWQAGELTWPERLKTAVCLNIRLYLIMGLALVFFVIYLAISEQTSLGSVSGFLMALANTYGLLFIILLLGQGLVEVPRQLWQTSFPALELRRLYFIATQVDSDVHDSMFKLEETERDLDSFERAIETGKASSVQDRSHLRQLLDEARQTAEEFRREIDDERLRSARFTGKHGSRRWDDGRTASDALNELGVYTVSAADAARLHCELRAAQMKVVATRMRWASLLRETDTLLCLVNDEIRWGPGLCAETPGATTSQAVVEFWRRFKWRLGWIWRVYLRSLVCRGVAVLCALLSGLILWSEVVVESRWNLSPFGILLRAMYQKQAGVAHAISMQAVVLVPFLYMSLCCYRSLFTLKIFGAFTLQEDHHTLPGPLLFNAQYLIRLQFPLGYNFMRILRYYGTESTRVPGLMMPAFQKLMNDMTTVPVLGTSFNIYAPMVLIVLCLFTFFKGYARVLRLVGLEHEDLVSIQDSEGEERLAEGRTLIERGKRRANIAALRRQGETSVSPTSSTDSLAGQRGAGYIAPSLVYSQIGNDDSPENPDN